MRVPRVVVQGVSPAGSLVLPPAESRHVARVLRRGPGDPLILLDGRGGALRAVVVSVEAPPGEPDGASPRVEVRVEGPIEDPGPPGVPWRVAGAMVKGRGMETAIRLASELGLRGWVPLLTERGIVRSPGEAKRERWQRIAAEAAKQCGRRTHLSVEAPSTLDGLLDGLPGRPAPEPVWMLRPGGDALEPSTLLGPSGLEPALFLVGPEGGFTPREEACAEAAGARSLALPTPVLRTPTAVLLVAALAVILASDARERKPPADRGFGLDGAGGGR